MAQKTLDEVRAAMKLNYFDTDEFAKEQLALFSKS